MPFVKLDCGILDSSLWVEPAETRVVFLTMLAMSDPEGLCRSTAPGIARRANLPIAKVRQALKTLESPDHESRTTTDQGRRVRRVDGGYFIINYLPWRNHDYTGAQRQKRWRDRQKPVTVVTGDVTDVTRNVTQADNTREEEKREEKKHNGSTDGVAQPKLTDEETAQYYEAVRAAVYDKANLPQTRMLSSAECELIRSWIERGWPLRIVLRGIEDCGGHGAKSLLYFKPAVEEAVKKWREATG